MLGVFIKYGGRGQFYALPENPGDTEIIYNKITQHYAKRLYYVAGGSGAMSLGGGSPSIYHITVTIAADQGLKLYLPDAKNLTADYDLTKYNVGQISSILLQYRGPWKNKESYRAGQITNPVANAPATTVNPVVNAPPSGPDTRTASTVSTPQPAQIKGAARKDVLVSAGKTSPAAIPDLSGQWKSSVGLMYALTQKGNQFEWTVAGTNEKAQGTVQGSAVSASWKGPQGSGSATGQITKVDASGKATQIEWKNGVKFFR
jgi:hypothetical protein